MTLYPPINPDGKPACWPQQHMEQIAGHCDACGRQAHLYPIAEGPICGPAAICADCIWELTPRDLHLDQPLFAIARREIESRQPDRAVPARILAPAKFLLHPPESKHRLERVCEGQMAFDFTVHSRKQPRPTAPIAAAHDKPRSLTAVSNSVASCVGNPHDGISCDACGQLIRVYLDNAVVGRSGERCCLDCFEARHNLEPFIVTAAWLDEHGAELEQEWRFIHNVAELMPNSAP